MTLPGNRRYSTVMQSRPSRRDMLHLALAATGLATAPLAAAAAPPEHVSGAGKPADATSHPDSVQAGTRIVEIASGVFVHTGVHGVYSPANLGDISNNGFVIGRDSVAVVDTGGTARLGQRLRDAVASITDRPIRYVINTHMHPDHVFGNSAFRGDRPEFVGHHNLAAALANRADRYLAYNRAQIGEEAFAGTEVVLPTRAVETSLDLDLGGRVLHLHAHRTAHTDNDLTVHDTSTGTVFMGDLVFAGHVPTLDGSIRGWIALLDELTAKPAQRIVPGHGPASMAWPDAAAPLQRYLAAVADGVRAAIRDGRTLSDAVATVARSESANWELFDDFHARNVAAAFAELEWE